ncbi:MAG: hypothetical protein KatS3mg023_0601 [Armatimonadota bacterium]|nr:MAG: hypothetical protein KatS3mg023_0601 [Armatimonadota bacterium]
MMQAQIPDELLKALTAEPVKPSGKQWLGSALGAMLFRRGTPDFLTAPLRWANSQNALRQAQARLALDAMLKMAGLGIEQAKANAPIEVARIREEGATARSREQLDLERQKLQQVEIPKSEAEKARIEAQTAETIQRTQLSPRERYTRLAEQYAQYLGSERYTPQGDEAFRRALSMLAEEIGAEPPTSEQPPQPSPVQAKTQAETELTRERATTERELREPRRQQIQARTNLIKAETLLAARRADEVSANISALRQRVAQGWANVNLRARGLALAHQTANDKLLMGLLRNASATVQNIDAQIAELRKAKAQLQYPMGSGGAGMPAYDPGELDALIRELQQQRDANAGIIQLGSMALQKLQQRLKQ